MPGTVLDPRDIIMKQKTIPVFKQLTIDFLPLFRSIVCKLLFIYYSGNAFSTMF